MHMFNLHISFFRIKTAETKQTLLTGLTFLLKYNELQD